MCLDSLEQSRACRLSILGKTAAFSAQHIGPKFVTRIKSLVTMCRQEQRQLMNWLFRLQIDKTSPNIEEFG